MKLYAVSRQNVQGSDCNMLSMLVTAENPEAAIDVARSWKCPNGCTLTDADLDAREVSLDESQVVWVQFVQGGTVCSQ